MKIMCSIKGTDNDWLSVVNPPHTLNYVGYVVYILAFNEWLQQLHNPLDSNSESGGKLTLYRQYCNQSQYYLGTSLPISVLVVDG